MSFYKNTSPRKGTDIRERLDNNQLWHGNSFRTGDDLGVKSGYDTGRKITG